MGDSEGNSAGTCESYNKLYVPGRVSHTADGAEWGGGGGVEGGLLEVRNEARKGNGVARMNEVSTISEAVGLWLGSLRRKSRE